MKRCTAIALLLILIPVLGVAQKKSSKHSEVPAVLQYAHFVYVEALDGDAMKPGLFPEDRRAIFDVQDALRDWNRYTLANRREEADVVLVVRKGRIAGVQARVGVSVGPGTPGSQTSSRTQGQVGEGPAGEGNGVSAGAEGEAGPENDMLRVYLVHDGELIGPVWTREIPDGLDAPGVVLVRQLRAAVERAYPSQPTAGKPTP